MHASPPRSPSSPSAAAQRTSSGGGGRPRRVLLVEDEPLVRMLLAEALAEDGGLEVDEAADGAEAVALLEAAYGGGPAGVGGPGAGGFGLLLTDVHMPGAVDGVGVATRARALDPTLPVVFATGRPDALVGAFGPLGRREACLEKPFAPSEALALVERLLRDTEEAMRAGR